MIFLIKLINHLLSLEIAFETSIYHSYEERKGDEYETLIDHRHPNCVTFDSDGRLYAGDSLGEIHVYSLRVRSRIFLVNGILLIIYSVYTKPHLLIHS